MRERLQASSLAASKRLDEVEALRPGEGLLELSVLLDNSLAGGTAAYHHRLNHRVSAFAEAWAGYDFDNRQAAYGGVGGLRVRF